MTKNAEKWHYVNATKAATWARSVYACHSCAFACTEVQMIAVCLPTASEMPRFSHADDAATQGQKMCGIKTAKLREGETFTYSKAPICWKTPECCMSREEFTALLWPPKQKKNPQVFVIFIKRSSFTPSATRLQMQGNQTHLFSPEERSSLTAAFNGVLVKCTHQVALFSEQSDKNARGNCSDTVMTCNIQICFKSCWHT